MVFLRKKLCVPVGKDCRGFALALIFEGEDNLMIAARSGPPLAIGYGKDEFL